MVEEAGARHRRRERHVGDQQLQETAECRTRHHAGGPATAGNQPPRNGGTCTSCSQKTLLFMNFSPGRTGREIYLWLN